MSAQPIVPKHTLVERPAFRVVGVALRTSNSRPDEIGAFFQKFFRENTLARIPARTDDRMLALYSEYENDHTGAYTLTLGASVETGRPIPAGLVACDVPAQRYAVIEARGAMPAALIDAWKSVWSSALPRSFGADFDAHLGPAAADVHVALR